MTDEHERLVRKLQSIKVLSPEDVEGLKTLPLILKLLASQEDVVSEGDRPSQCCLLLEGYLCRYKILPSGGRQIMSVHTPGDIPDLQSLHLKVMDHSLCALTPAKVAYIPHTAVRALISQFPRIGDAFWRDTLIDAAIFRAWLTGVGRRTSEARIAHLFCELFTRLRAVGLAGEDGFVLPLTQAEIGDALGLSTVHVNRSLQSLRAEGLVASKGRFLAIPDWERLKIAAEFDPTYLHLEADDT